MPVTASVPAATAAAKSATPVPAGLSRGVVKCVLSGDTLVVRGKPVKGPPPEKMLNLAGITAPRLASKSNSNDEPFAFAAREYLRKLLVGKEVGFRVDYRSQQGNPPREYATVFAGSENVAKALVAAGLAKVRHGDDRVDVTELLAVEADAQQKQIGVWIKDAKKLQEAVKPIQYNLSVDASAFLAENKGKELSAVIDQVRDGSSMRIMLLPSRQVLTLFLSGVKAPAVKRDFPKGDSTAAGDAPAAPGTVSEPFGEEAKYFVESRLLQQEDVKVVLESTYNQNFIGSIVHPKGNIAEALLANGYATCLDATITGAVGGPIKLRNAERAAKEKGLRIWKGFVAKAAPQTGHENEFDGTVTRIWSGDTLTVASLKTGKELRVTLSSIRQPKTKDPKESYYHTEAREFLRARLIGQKVHVSVEYVRPAQENFEERVCATVTQGSINLAEALLNKGLASVIRTRQDNGDRSRHYDMLLLAEDKAQKAKKGIFSDKEPPVLRMADASENAAKARSYLPFYRRAGRMPAVIDYVLSASRFKVLIPKENAKLTLVLAGVRTPKHARPDGSGAEPFGQEAYAFANEKCFQHDVEVEIENVDKTGGFIGTIWLKGNVNLNVALLENGLAMTHGFSADQSPHANQLYSAETRAKAQRKNVWSTFTEAKEEAAEESSAPPKEELISVAVAEIFAAGHFCVQLLGSGTDKLEKLMVDLNVHCEGVAASTPSVVKAGDLLSAKYAEDGQWYRAKVKRVLPDRRVEVLYVDYGNSETVSISNTRTISATFTSLPSQSQEARLSFVQCPGLEDDYGTEAADYFSSLLKAASISANIDYRNGNVLHLTLFDPKAATPKDYASSLNAKMLRAGYAQLEKKPVKKFQSRVAEWMVHQEFARAHRHGMFEYGDLAIEEDY